MEDFEKSENLNNVIDFQKASESIRNVKPAKVRPQPRESTEILSFEKNRQKKDIEDLEKQLKELEEKINDLEKIAEKLEMDYNDALSEKDKNERIKRGSIAFNNLHKINTEIARLRGLSEEVKYKIRELKGE